MNDLFFCKPLFGTALVNNNPTLMRTAFSLLNYNEFDGFSCFRHYVT